MSDNDPQPGPSNEAKDDMTLAKLLSMPENANANLVMPLSWCPHLETIKNDIKSEDFDIGKKCESCDNIGENWICLVCHKVFCSRYVMEHMLMHGLESEHLMALSFSDLSVWCYGCDDYVDNERLHKAQNALHKNKFNGEEMPKKTVVINLSS